MADTECTILVVDDSTTFRNALGLRLRRDGYRVSLAESGHEALDSMARRAPDAVVLDLNMPGIDGLETCRHIRRTSLRSDLPILMLTASDDIRSRILGRAAGADEFLVKASDFEVVVTSVVDFVRRNTAKSANGRDLMPSGSRLATADDVVGESFLRQAVAASGLSRMIAEPGIERACVQAGVNPHAMRDGDLQRALPHIERWLKVFLSPSDLRARIDAIAQLAAPPKKGAGLK